MWGKLFLACYPNGKWHIVDHWNCWTVCGIGASKREWTWGQEITKPLADYETQDVCKTCLRKLAIAQLQEEPKP